MGTIFEELIRKFNEALNENPGEHFTPRDVVDLMVDLMLAGDEARIGRRGVVCTVYDPCCGSGGMLTITKDHINVGLRRNGDMQRSPINPDAEIHLFGQEVHPETWAGDRAGTCIDPSVQIVDGLGVCVVSCQRSPEPMFLTWKNLETNPDGDLYVRSGPGTIRLAPESAREYIRTRFTPGA
jgi:hypothetical protein